MSLAPVLKSTTNYLMSPNLYQYGQPVDILLNKIESDVNSLSYPFYDLPYICSPIESEKVAPQSLSDLIFGDQKVKSGYMLRFGVETTCATLCIKKVSYEGMKMLKGHIEDAYVSQWLIDDNLPAATIFAFEDAMFYASGFPMGIVDGESGETLLYNHLHMVVRYRHVDKTHFSILEGFEIYPRSLYDNNCPGCLMHITHHLMCRYPKIRTDMSTSHTLIRCAGKKRQILSGRIDLICFSILKDLRQIITQNSLAKLGKFVWTYAVGVYGYRSRVFEDVFEQEGF